jgi:thymidylate synthase (FAD)
MGVELVARTTGCGPFEGYTGEQLIIAEARVSSNRKDLLSSPDRLIRHLINEGHWSPFDQASLTFKIDCSVAMSIQLLRHWSFKVQQFSQRYATVTSASYPTMRMKGSTNRQGSTHNADNWLQTIAHNSINRSLTAYEELVAAGVANESARFVLPMSTRTTLYYKGDVRNIITFLNARLHKTAQLEARDIARSMMDIFTKEFPIISSALNNFKGAESFHILDQVCIMANLDNIETIKELWHERA